MDGSFEVIGEDGEVYEVSADDVMGAIMGDVGAAGSRRRRRSNRSEMSVERPHWRDKQLAPGVQAPDQGLMPLPLTALQAGGIFAAATPTITFQGQLQKPFRGERVLVSTVRTGASATGRLLAQIFVGTDLQQADVQGFDIEQVGETQAFGVRLTMQPAQPGVLVRIITNISPVPTGGDTVQTNMQILGRIIS